MLDLAASVRFKPITFDHKITLRTTRLHHHGGDRATGVLYIFSDFVIDHAACLAGKIG